MTRVIETVTEYQDKPPCRTAAQMTTLCCEKKPALPCCEKVEPWSGYTDAEILDRLGIVLDSQGRDDQGRKVIIERLPRKGLCGEQVTKYDLTAKNCCDKVTPLAFDHAATPEILPHGRSIIIAWTGSDGREVTVTTSSNATWFSDGRKTAIGHGDSIEIFAGPTFCGATSVSVTDHCSVATVVLRSDMGQWVDRGPICGLPGEKITTPLRGAIYVGGTCGYVEWSQVIAGKYKQLESVLFCGIDIPVANPGGCSGSLSPECYKCLGDTYTCPAGQAARPPVVATCLSYPDDMLGLHSLQAYCGNQDFAGYGMYLTPNACINYNNVYGFVVPSQQRLYEWMC